MQNAMAAHQLSFMPECTATTPAVRFVWLTKRKPACRVSLASSSCVWNFWMLSTRYLNNNKK